MRYIIGFLVTIGLIIVLVFLLFHGGQPKTPLAPKTLESYAQTDAEVRLTIDGPINAAQNHQAIRITVDRNNVTYEQLKGYDGTIVNQQIFASGENAFDVFLHALYHAGFSRYNTAKNLADERGYCPLGNRFIFELIQAGNTQERFWSTSCGSPKTYNGNLSLSVSLFQAQVPGYSNLAQNINFTP